jgi:phage gp36-like protein
VYVTQAELEERFGSGDIKSWTDDDASGAIDAAVVTRIITDVSALIDAAAAQHYATPLTLGNATTAAVVKDVAGSLAGYRLAARRAGVVPEALRKLYDDALAWLKDLRDGKVGLADETATAVTRPAGGIIVAGGSKLVDRDTMEGL